MTADIRVLLADDHPPTRAGVRASIEGHGFVVCAEVGDAASAVSAALRERPDLCLLDIHMPGSGITAAAQITAADPDVTVVMLTVSGDEDDLFEALRAGAMGYLLKDIDPDRLPTVLRGVLAGEAALPRTLVTRVMQEFSDRRQRRSLTLPGRRRVQLTDREWEVLELLRRDLSTSEIAHRLHVTPATVRSHVAAVLHKLRVPDRASARRLFEAQRDEAD